MYQWFVFAHLVGLVLFLFAHGTSAFITYQIRTIRDPDVVSGYLVLSLQATRVAYVGLILLILGGASAATVNGLWGQPWVWGSAIVLFLVLIAMYAFAANYYRRLRGLLAGMDGQPPIDSEGLAAYLDSRRPDMIAGVGALGLLILVWLMVMKPG